MLVVGVVGPVVVVVVGDNPSVPFCVPVVVISSSLGSLSGCYTTDFPSLFCFFVRLFFVLLIDWFECFIFFDLAFIYFSLWFIHSFSFSQFFDFVVSHLTLFVGCNLSFVGHVCTSFLTLFLSVR